MHSALSCSPQSTVSNALSCSPQTTMPAALPCCPQSTVPATLSCSLINRTRSTVLSSGQRSPQHYPDLWSTKPTALSCSLINRACSLIHRAHSAVLLSNQQSLQLYPTGHQSLQHCPALWSTEPAALSCFPVNRVFRHVLLSGQQSLQHCPVVTIALSCSQVPAGLSRYHLVMFPRHPV